MASYTFTNDCHKPRWVPVGDSKVFLCGYRDFEDREGYTIQKKLDVFIGLDGVWADQLPHSYSLSNSLVVGLFNKAKSKMVLGLDNLIILPVADGGIHLAPVNLIYDLLKAGKKVGFGCIGGHGRTGWVLGQLIKRAEKLNGKKLLDTIHQRWCDEAPESELQHRQLGVPYTEFSFSDEDDDEKEEERGLVRVLP